MKPFHVKIAVAALTASLLSAFFFCERTNPFDAKSARYVSGSRPQVVFEKDSLTGYLYDTIPIRILCRDTTVGGEKGAIKKFYFSWDNDTVFEDSTPGTDQDTFLVKHVFGPGVFTARVMAVDEDGRYSAHDSIRLIIKKSVPAIVGMLVPHTVETGARFTITITASDQGGTISAYLWALDGFDFMDTTADATISSVYYDTGQKTIPIKVLDNKGIVSPADTVHIAVVLKPDTTPPTMVFLAPLNGDSVNVQDIPVYVQATDENGVASVSLNGAALSRTQDVWKGQYHLNAGTNLLVAQAVDTRGNIARDTIAVVCNASALDRSPPTVIFRVPPHKIDTVNTAVCQVRIFVVDESGIAGEFLNGTPMARDPTDSTYVISMLLAEGWNVFAIKSVDTKGNIGYDTLNIFHLAAAIDITPPSITISDPAPLKHIADTAVLVRGIATDASGLASVTINGAAAAVAYPDFSLLVKLRHGPDTLRVTAVDSSANRNAAFDTVVVVQNFPPKFSAGQLDTHLTVNTSYAVALHAVDADNDSLKFKILQSPAAGTTMPSLVSVGSTATLQCTPTATGTDTFAVLVQDGWGGSDTAQWRVFVTAPGDSVPIFTNDKSTVPDSVVALSAYIATVKAQDPQNKPLTYALAKPPSPSAMSIDATGRITWTPQAGDTGKFQVLVSASNGRQSASLGWTVTVVPYNWPPVLVNPGNKSVDKLKLLRFTLVASDADGDPLDFFFGPQFPLGARLDSAVFSWTPSYWDAGQHAVSFVVRERNRAVPLSDTQNIVITVNNVNVAPVLVNPGAKSAVVNQNLSFALAASDMDVGQTLTYSMAGAPAGASLSGNQFSWTPAYSQIGQYTVMFYVKDNGAPVLGDSAAVAITVLKANVAPVLADPGNKTVNENQPVAFNLSASDVNGDSIRFSAEALPPGATLSGAHFNWTPSYTQSGVYVVKFYATDNGTPPLADSQSITITVNNVNAPPVLANPGNKSVSAGKTLAFTLSATDVDNNSLSYSMQNAPTGAALAGNQFSWTPVYAQIGQYQILFIVKDNGSPPAADSALVTVTVNKINIAPVLASPGNRSVNEGQLLQFTLSATDVNGDSLTFSMAGAPAGAVLAGGQFSWTPSYTAAGVYDVKFRVTDNGTPPMSDSQTISITVNDVNVPPVLANPGNQTVNENRLLGFSLSATDIDGDQISFFVKNPPSGASLTGPQFTWVPAYGQAGTYSVMFYARDNGVPQMSDSQVVSITVVHVNVAPVLAPIGNKLAAETKPLQFVLSATDSNQDVISYSMRNAPAGASLAANQFSWTPAYGQAGTYAVAFFASDNEVPPLSDSQTITITVSATLPAAPLAPSATPQSATAVSVSWPAAAGALTYNIYYAAGATVTKTAGTKIAGAASPATVVGLTTGTQYAFAVSSQNSAGESGLSPVQTATPMPPIPNAPVIQSAAAGNGTVTVSWAAVTGATSYILYYAAGGTVDKTTLTKVTGAVSPQAAAGLINGTQYAFAVSAVNISGESPLSPVQTATPQQPVPGAPLISNLLAGDGSVTVSFSSVSGSTSYNIYYQAGNTVSKAAGVKVAGVVSPALVSGLTNGTQYAFAVSAQNVSGESDLSPVQTATPQPAVPAAPAITGIAAGDGAVTVTFGPSARATSYNVYYQAGSSIVKGTAAVLTGAVTPATVSGLANGTQYAFAVSAVNVSGESPLSQVQTATPQPAVPAAPAITAVAPGNASATVAFGSSARATSYNLYYQPGLSVVKGSASVITGATSPQAVGGLTNGTQYAFAVAAVNISGESPLSAVQTATPLPPLPAAPAITSAIPGNASVTVGWNSVSGATSYNLYFQAGDSVVKTSATQIPGASSPRTVAGLANGTKYAFAVTAVNIAGESPLSAPLAATPLPAVPPAPAITGALAGNTSVSVAWSAASGATSYNLYYQAGSSIVKGTAAVIAGAASPQAVTGLANGTQYAFAVTGVNIAGESPLSAVQTATPMPPTPGAPLISSVLAGNATVTLTWAAVPGATSYNVYYEPGNSVAIGAASVVTGGASPQIVSGLVNAVQYAFAVTAVNASGESPLSAVQTATPMPPVPAAPVISGATPGDASVSVGWVPVSGATSYNIYYQTGNTVDKGTATVITGAASPRQITGLADGTQYAFAVTAVNASGESPLSAVQTATPMPPVPAAPAIGGVTAGDASATVTWAAAAGATSYNLYYQAGSAVSRTTASVIAGATSPGLVSGLVNGTQYAFAVTAVNMSGESPLSAAQTATPMPPVPAAPVIGGLTASNDTVMVSWNAVPGAASYNLYYATGNTFVKDSATVLTEAVSPFILPGLIPAVQYWFTVTAVNLAGESPPSASVSVTP